MRALFSSVALVAFLVMPLASNQAGPTAPTAAPRPGLPPRDTPATATTGTARIRGRVFAADTVKPLDLKLADGL